MPDPSVEVPQGARQAFAAWRAETRTNPYLRDPALELALRLFAPEVQAARADALCAFGERVATELEVDAETATRDENIPRLEAWDGLGERTEGIELHPAYQRMAEVMYGARIMADYRTAGQEAGQLGLFYLAAHQGEAPHLCPLSCTAGLIKALQAKGSPELQERYLPGLLDPDHTRNLVGAQFITEVQGGSDVGLGAVEARPIPGQPGAHEIHGEKWFCSVINADLFLLSARVPGQGDGTAGLGCFVVPRRLPDGSLNRFRIRRLKKKLGTRAMASGEVDWLGSTGYALGPLDEGFKTIVGIVLQTSRVYNAVGTSGSTMRAYLDAAAYARHRVAFGAPVARFPEVRRTLAGLKATAWACTLATFHVVSLADATARGEGGEDERAALRMLTNVNKYWTSILNTRSIRTAMEVLGGNGTIEDFSVLPRLFRDAMVFESWEGAHNVLAAQVLRDCLRYRMDEPMLAALGALVDAGAGAPGEATVRARLEALTGEYRGLRELAPEAAQDAARGLVDRTAAVHQAAVLLRAAAATLPGDLADQAAAVLAQHLEQYRPELLRPTPLALADACLGA